MHALINMDPPSIASTTTSDGGIIEQSLIKSSPGPQARMEPNQADERRLNDSSTAQLNDEKTVPPKLEDKTSESESLSEKSSATKTCSVKLVDIVGPNAVKTTGESLKRDQPPGQVSESDEPNAKKSRSSLPVDNMSAAHRVLLKPKDFVDLKRRTVSGFKPTSNDDKVNQEEAKPIDTSTFDNVEEELGRLFGGSNSPTKKDNKVTISPVKSGLTKDVRKQSVNAATAPTSSPSLPASSSGGSVTITKLSTGSSLSVESKDLKTVLSGGSSGGRPQSATAQPNQSQAKSENGVRLKGNIDITALGASAKQSSLASAQAAEAVRCNKCGIEYSTKEARRLHTCNSILDQHYLSVENAGERSNSKSSSPTSPSAPAGGASSETVTSGTTATSSSSPSSFDSASSRSNSPMMDQWNNSRKISSSNSSTASNASSNANVKLIKEKSDKLIIEGRPKLSVTKVSKTEMEKASPPLPKFKLSTDADKNKSRWTTAGDNSMAAYSGKLKIKVGGAPPTGSEKQSSDTGPEGGLAFSFAGKPTYSPSRIEPSNTNSGAVQTKESPRDASNKDSPASQADSGVYSIASSSSPSKGDAAPTTESTSPDSPNRDRMAFPEQNYGRDIQWKSAGQPSQGESKSYPQQPTSQQQSCATSSAASFMTSSQARPVSSSVMMGTSGQPSMTTAQSNPRSNPTHDPFAKPTADVMHHQQQHQQQQQQQQQMYQQQWAGRVPQYPMGAPGQMANEMMQRQYSYASQNFFLDSDTDPPKRKRGRPRKNPLKEPTTAKRKYTRKKPVAPNVAPVGPSGMAPPGSYNGLKSVMNPESMSNAMMDASSSPSVYNFDEEEEGGVQPMRPRRANANPKKYSFGSSSDEDASNNKAMMGAYHQGYPMMRPMMRPQMMNAAQHNMMMMKNQQQMSMEMHHRMMMQQQQMMQQRQQQHQQQQTPQQQQQQQQQSSQQQHQAKIQQQQQQQQMQQQQQQQQSGRPEDAEGLSYSSEVLTKPTGGIGIKIKIKKAAEPSDKMNVKKAKRDDASFGPQSTGLHQSSPSTAPKTPSTPVSDPMRDQSAPQSSQYPMPPKHHQQQQQQQQHHQQQLQSSSQQSQSQLASMQAQQPSSNSSVMQQQASSTMNSGPMMTSRAPPMVNPNSPMYVNQRNMQNSPMHSGHTTPSPIRSPYHAATSPSPQHPGYGQMHGNFNRFQQPGGMMAPNGGNYGNYGYGHNYRNPQQYPMGGNMNSNMDANSGFYNNQYNNFSANGMRFPGPGGGQYYGNGQMQQQSQQQQQHGFNNGGGVGNDFHNMQQQQQNSSDFYGNNAGGYGMGAGGQPIPPHYRGNMMQHSPGHPMGSPIGPPRISPSSMHKPMPGVGMPRASPSMSNNGMRQQTPLVSPQSMHSDQPSPSSTHNPTTPASCSTTPGGLPHGGMTSPMYNMPKTPQHQSQQAYQQHSMTSPSPRSGPASVPPVQSPMTEDLKSPAALKSPLPYSSGASNLRKIRRPSKPNNASPPPAEPLVKHEVKEENPLPAVEEEPKKEEPKFEARWEELEEKLWKRIFQFCSYNDGSVPFLVRAQRVCKKWKNVATSDPLLWTHLDLSQGRGFKERYRNDKKLEWFLKKYGNVQELKLGGWKNSVGPSTIKVIAQYCPNLISLGLCGCFKLTNEDLKLIGDSFPKLERIDLSGVSPSSSSSRSAVSSTCLTDFITVLGARLTVLNISNNKMAGLPFVFKALSTHSVSLEELDISNITTTSRDTININLEKFQKGCQKLRILNANHTMLSLTETPVREQVNSPGFPDLEELHIAVDSRGYFDGMDDSQIERVLAKSAKLRVLDVRGCQHISNSCLIRLKSWVIERLILAGCPAASDSSESIELLVKKLNKLTELDISLTVGERTINNAVAELADIDTPVLRKLNLCSTAVSLKPLTRLLKNCHTLEHLNLASCRGLPRGIKRLYSNRDTVVQLRNDILDGKFTNCDNDDDDE